MRAKARTAAVAAAREKAALYAEAAGARLGPVIHIKDIDSDQLQNSYRSHRSSSDGSGDGDLTPGKISVSAGVVLGLSLING
ncbi:SIMPL domain-containing protein [Kitasatospora sp. NPDC091257]|uniref:SIMPL domain-containing protein n=1 Tax=Kitasatospora sp. NPDC091257 TaxID=3364084 RepID=UPI00381E1FFC